MTAPDLGSLLARAERALRGTTIDEVVENARTRAIIGAAKREAEYPALAVEALEMLRAGQAPSANHLAALEGVIRAFRPAPYVQRDVPNDLDATTGAAFPGWRPFRDALRPYARSIGRVDLVLKERPLVTQAIGTGFLVGEDLLATNRHVVLQLTRGTGVIGGDTAVVFFRYEYNVAESGNAEATRVVGVAATHPTLDLALLALEPGATARPPLPLADAAPAEAEPVAVVGYPSDDPRNPVLSKLVIGDRPGVKRAAPGEVLAARAESLFHDCSTLGGNSGSPVLSLRDARVVGLHRDGYFLYRNEAVAARALGDFVASR